jgi:hypothetical protein
LIGTQRLVLLATLAVATTLMLARLGSRPLLAQAFQVQDSSGASSQPGQDTMPGMHHQGDAMNMVDMPHGNHPMPARGGDDPCHLSSREWSIFNHRGAGWFLFLWGLTAFIAGVQWPRKTWHRFVPPLMLFGLVEFLFIRNDPEAWPTGSIGLWESLNDPEVFQHRIFVLLLFAMAIVELLRAGDRLSPSFAKYALPSLAVAGGIYLFFHKHGGVEMEQMMQHTSYPAMASSPAMKSMLASMDLVKHEHMWFSISGFGLAVTKLLAETGRFKGRFGATLWTLFAIILGVYMMGYTE